MKFKPQTKQPKALWTRAFPSQVKPGPAKKPRKWHYGPSKAQRKYLQAASKWKKGRNCECSYTGVCSYAAHGAEDVHHKRGRRGGNLMNESTWMAVCRTAHRWIHDNPKAATERGWLESRA
jgi:hypothetical protein